MVLHGKERNLSKLYWFHQLWAEIAEEALKLVEAEELVRTAVDRVRLSSKVGPQILRRSRLDFLEWPRAFLKDGMGDGQNEAHRNDAAVVVAGGCTEQKCARITSGVDEIQIPIDSICGW